MVGLSARTAGRLKASSVGNREGEGSLSAETSGKLRSKFPHWGDRGPSAAVEVPREVARRIEERLLRRLGSRLTVHADHDLALAVLARERDRDVAEREPEMAPCDATGRSFPSHQC